MDPRQEMDLPYFRELGFAEFRGSGLNVKSRPERGLRFLLKTDD
jgi:hypothetical protein